MKTLPLALIGSLSFGLLTAAAHAQAPTPGDEYRVTTEMSGRGMSLPGTTQTICVPRNRPPEEASRGAMPQGCRILEQRASGNTVRMRMTCRGEFDGEMDSEITNLPNGWRSRMTMRSADGEMRMSQSGERTGRSCDASAAEREMNRMQAEAEAAARKAKEEQCSQSTSRLDASTLYFGPDAYCASGRASPGSIAREREQYCAGVRSARGYESLFVPANLKRVGLGAETANAARTGCQVNPEQLRGELCAAAEKNRTWGFMVRHCPEIAKPLAQRECAGRDFTALRGSRFANFCAAYASANQPNQDPLADYESTGAATAGSAGGAATSQGGAAQGASEAAPQTEQERAAEKAKRGLRILRDRIGF